MNTFVNIGRIKLKKNYVNVDKAWTMCVSYADISWHFPDHVCMSFCPRSLWMTLNIIWLLFQNLLSSRQIMNTSFEPFRIVNTYGAFGSVTKIRTEVIIEGTHGPDPNSPNAEWLEYDFKCKPGNLSQAPCLISPYHYRYIFTRQPYLAFIF